MYKQFTSTKLGLVCELYVYFTYLKMFLLQKLTLTHYLFLGFGPLPWAIMGEIFPSNLKSMASALTASFCWLLGFVLTKTFLMMSNCIGNDFSFWIFAVFCIVALLFTAFLLPQTEGKTLQEIQDMLHGRSKPVHHKMTRA